MDIELKDLLEEKRTTILKKWFDEIMETYPVDTSGFLKKQKDRFANPVGYTVSQGIESILGVLIQGTDFINCLPFLDNLIRVRAIQEFTPSQAMTFIFLLKKVVRKELEMEIKQNQISGALLEFESKIDDLALFSFDIYLKCREQLYQLKSNELKRLTFTLLKKANLMSEIPVQEFERQDQKTNI